MMPLSITIRPQKLYRRDGHLARGARRRDGIWGRTLALFDVLGITARKNDVAVMLSTEGYDALKRRADALGVFPSGLAAFLIEDKLREDRCPAGHDLSPDNVIAEKDGGRRCRACRRGYFQSRNSLRRENYAADQAEAHAS